MSSVMPFAFNAVELYVVTVNGKHWTRAKEVYKAWEYKKGKARDALKKHVSIENKQHKNVLQSRAMAARPMSWLKDSQRYDLYINEEGMYEVLFGSQQQKAKAFRKYCCNEMFPRIRKQLVDKMQEDHQKATEDRDNRIQAIEYENV